MDFYLKYCMAVVESLFSGARMYRSVMVTLLCPILAEMSRRGTPNAARLEAKERRPVWLVTNSYFRPDSYFPAWNTRTLSFIPAFLHISRIVLLNVLSAYLFRRACSKSFGSPFFISMVAFFFVFWLI